MFDFGKYFKKFFGEEENEDRDLFLEALDEEPLGNIFSCMKILSGKKTGLEESIIELSDRYNNPFTTILFGEKNKDFTFYLNEEGDTRDKNWNAMIDYKDENVVRLDIYENNENEIVLTAGVSVPGKQYAFKPLQYSSRTIWDAMVDSRYDMARFDKLGEDSRSTDKFLIGESSGNVRQRLNERKINEITEFGDIIREGEDNLTETLGDYEAERNIHKDFEGPFEPYKESMDVMN